MYAASPHLVKYMPGIDAQWQAVDEGRRREVTGGEDAGRMPNLPYNSILYVSSDQAGTSILYHGAFDLLLGIALVPHVPWHTLTVQSACGTCCVMPHL